VPAPSLGSLAIQLPESTVDGRLDRRVPALQLEAQRADAKPLPIRVVAALGESSDVVTETRECVQILLDLGRELDADGLGDFSGGHRSPVPRPGSAAPGSVRPPRA
jgi:hypothetical protein